ncbi:MAG: hypothetical protein QOH45_1600, partial [Pseudonocardiales bacterium]|nr:hypothetical protein [Pseudonocardiales bacterium]
MVTRIDSLEDASGFALSPRRQELLLAGELECTFCWTNADG